MDIDGNNYCPRCMRKLAETDTDVSACPLCGREPGTRRPPMALDSGTLLAGRYQLGDAIGRGGFGITYAAWDETLGMPVAVKEFFPREDATRDTEISDDLVPLAEREAVFVDGLSRFRRESNLLASLQGIPCVVKVMDFFSENGTAYIVMEFVHGTPIDRWVRENEIKPAALLEKLRPVADALVRTHSQGVIHRDVTPDNILVGEDGGLKLIDFGSAVEVERSGGTVLLTRRYAPVEQYGRDYGRQGPWTDVYSLAAVMYTLFSGQEPVEAPLRAHHDEQKPLTRMHTGLRHREAAAIDAALIVDPEKRTQSMAEFRAALYHLPMPEEVIRRKRFTRRVIAAAAVLLLLLGLVTLNFTTGLPIGSGLLGSVRSNGIHIVRQLRKQEEVSIPESVLGIPVSEIGDSAFRGDDALRRANVPGNVCAIGDSAFYGCDKLEEVSLAEGVESIGNLAFSACGSLQTLMLPDSLTAIGNSALPAEASQMTVWCGRGTAAEQYSEEHELRLADPSELSWEIHDGTAEITSVYSDAKRLTLPNFVEGVPVTEIREGVQLWMHEEVWLPEYLEIVTPYLFYGEDVFAEEEPLHLQQVRMGHYVREIGVEAFANCYQLRELVFPDTLERIGEHALWCTGLSELILPDGLREIGENAFEGCQISSLKIPNSVESIGKYAFTNTHNLAGIELPDTLQSIPVSAFSFSAIPNLVLPDTVTDIEVYAFKNSGLHWIALPDGVRTIAYEAFADCADLEFILIPDSVEYIDDQAFTGCSSDLVIAGHNGTTAEEYANRMGVCFESIDQWMAPDSVSDDGTAYYGSDRPETMVRVPYYSEEKNILITGCYYGFNPYIEEIILSRYQTKIEDFSFYNDTALRRVSIEGEIVGIGSCAFDGCSSLQAVPTEKTESIEMQAFQSCTALTSLSLENAEHIESSAFERCLLLREIQLSDDLTYITSHVFQSCTSLRYVVLPEHLRDISSQAFLNCSSLQLAVFPEGVRTAFESTPFKGCTALRAIYCSSGISRLNVYLLEENCPQIRDIWVYNPEAEFWGAYFAEDPPAWTVHGYAGSTAEQWAKENSVSFEPIPGGTAMPDPWEIVETFDFEQTEEETGKT
ncbi:MAG: leucine-rich repeat protein [Clostridiales bacterium]|nr:leucine-rich repeat protein [Clostridiales bacterium]